MGVLPVPDRVAVALLLNLFFITKLKDEQNRISIVEEKALIPTQQHTAVLFFSRTPDAEAKAKDFFGIKSHKHNKKLAQAFFDHTLSAVKGSGLPFFLFTEKEQSGNSFGEKLFHAAEAVFGKGYQQLIIVGNDCPHLNATHLQTAAQALQNKAFVLSPTKKGGVSLIGITKQQFDETAFEAIDWQTSKVAHQLRSLFCAHSNAIFYLQIGDDINHKADLKKVLSTSAFSRVLAFIKSLLASVFKHVYYSRFHIYSIQNALIGLRAPPAC